jgi:hypothetical protein
VTPDFSALFDADDAKGASVGDGDDDGDASSTDEVTMDEADGVGGCTQLDPVETHP